MNQDIQHFIQGIRAAALALAEKRDDVNRLNVFPVPDGDTGTNLSLTIETVVTELDALPHTAGAPEVLKAITHGSLMGARGNSGVILSQILRGLCEGLAGAESFDAAAINRAASRSVEVAFNAVRKPVEGTILTVLRDCAGAAAKAEAEGKTAAESLRALSAEALASVRRTPELLAVLKENGVVDAGGFGLAILIEGFTAALLGEGPTIPATSSLSHPEPLVAIEQINDWEGSAFLYCTEFLLRAEELDEEAAADFLASMGDCELLVGASPDYKVHVHTNEPGAVLTYMTTRGQVAEVHIHNMRLQSESRTQGLTAKTEEAKPAAPLKEIGYIAVAAGQGTAKILEAQGVDFVVQGGQTMNPSTKDFVDAIAAVNAKSVILFPNNKNIIMAANAAVEIADKPAAVVPTTSVPQSFSALFAANEAAGLEDNVEAMTQAALEVRTAEVTTAVKNAKASNGKAIRAGDVIGIFEGSLDVVGTDVAEVGFELVNLLAEDADILTILAGADFSDKQVQAFTERIEEAWPELEVDCQRGEQPLYPLILAAE